MLLESISPEKLVSFYHTTPFFSDSQLLNLYFGILGVVER